MRLSEAPDVLTVAQVAELLQVNKKTIYEVIHRQEIAVVRLGRVIRVPRQSLSAYLGIETTNGVVELLGVFPDDPHGVE